MQIVRTIVWVLLLLALLIFSINNWNPVEVKIWEGLVLETKIPALVVIAFLIGLVPMWLLHRGTRWHLQRRINSLEAVARTHAAAPVTVHDEPLDERERIITPADTPPLQETTLQPAPVQSTPVETTPVQTTRADGTLHDRHPPIDEYRPRQP